MALTGKKKRFADAVLAGKSNKDAAIAAGYSAKTASAAGSRLVKDKDVVSYIGNGRKAEKNQQKTSAESSGNQGSSDSGSDSDGDMLRFLQDVALGRTGATNIQVRAAIAAVQYTHTKRGDGGKKEEKDAAAKKAAQGKFSPAAPPKLVVNNRK